MQPFVEGSVYLGIIATLIVQFLAIVWVGLLKQPKPSKGIMRWIVAGVAIIWGYFYADVTLPSFDDPMLFIIALVEGLGAIVVIAHNAYEVILKPIMEWLDAKVLKGRSFFAP